MKTLKIVLTCLVLSLCTTISFAQSLSGKNAEELKKMQTEAIANENYELADKIEKQLKRIEANKAKIAKLEAEKKDAILVEDYAKAEELENQISALKSGKTVTTTNTNKAVTPSSTVNTAPPSTISTKANTIVNQTAIVPMPSQNKQRSDYNYNEKMIASIGLGIGSSTYNDYSYSYYSESSTNMSFDYNLSPWWINKYIVGGIFESVGVVYEGLNIGLGTHLTVLADFDAVVLPYTSLGLGFGINGYSEEFYLPIVYRVGSYLYFSKNRTFGVFTEYNIDFNNEYLPKLRWGIAFTPIKRKYK